VVQQLRALGYAIVVHECPQSLPTTGAEGDRALDQTLLTLPTGTVVVLDGLAAGAHPKALEAHAARLKLVVLVHHPLALESGISTIQREYWTESERVSLALAHRVMCTSHATAAVLATAYGVAAERLHVVQPGVARLPASVPSRSAKAPWRLLCVATISPRKGHDLLLDVLAQLTGFRWDLECVGSLTHDRPHAQRVLAQTHWLGLQARVRFWGELPDTELAQQFQAAHLFVSGTHYEGFGMALAEAIAWGLPVIATAGGAVSEACAYGTAELMPAGDAAGLKAALERFFSQPNYRTELLRAAGNPPEPRSWARVAEEFAEAL
jgi:glycosyltransferase involved in cell wall biosynthesis